MSFEEEGYFDERVHRDDKPSPKTPSNLRVEIEHDLLDMWLKWEQGDWYLNEDDPNYDKDHDRRFRDAIADYIIAAFKSSLDGIELPEKKRANGDLDSDYRQGESNGFNDCLTEVQTAIEKYKGAL